MNTTEIGMNVGSLVVSLFAIWFGISLEIRYFKKKNKHIQMQGQQTEMI